MRQLLLPAVLGRCNCRSALARLCGIGLSQGALAKLVPIGGAVVAAASTYAFMESIIDAAIHLAAREALLRKVGSTRAN
jgi:hypothetical protein